MQRLGQFVFAAGLSMTLAAALLSAGDSKKDDPGQIGNRDVSKGVNFYSLEKERALGRQLAQEVERQAKIVDDPLVAEYINRLGQNLVRNSDAKAPFTFKVIESPEVNAFALPGGYVFVYSGLVRIADEEDELAAAMAHEIAHVAARHMTRQATKTQLANMAAIPAGVFLGGWTGYAARQGARLAIPMTFLNFARKDESEADYLGVQYLYAAGYDPTGAISIFEKMEALERRAPGTISRAFSTHPMDADRIARTEKEIEAILPARPEYVVTTSDYAAMRQRLMARETPPQKSAPEQPTLKTAPGAKVPGATAGPGSRR
jgi:predicted Zn-dependent protease